MGKRNKKEPRFLEYYFDFGEVVKANIDFTPNGGITFRQDGNKILPKVANISIVKDKHNPDKGQKKIVDLPINPENQLFKFDLIGSLARFDCVYVIDTNTLKDPIDGKYTSAGIIMECDNLYQRIVSKQNKCKYFGRVFIHEEQHLGEKIVLTYLINKALKEKVESNPNIQIGIITDHGLGNIEKINSREMPIISGTQTFLPNNFTLIYASADKKNDSILNHLIGVCDKRASELLNQTKPKESPMF